MAFQTRVPPAPENRPASVVVPFEEDVWKEKAVYDYQGEASQFFGSFSGVDGEKVFAPERGNIFPRPDGGVVISVSGGDTDRQWLFGPVKDAVNVWKNGDVIDAGQLVGTVAGPELRLALLVAPKGSTAFQGLDPVEVLQKSGAVFPDDLDDKVSRGPRAKPAEQPQASSSAQASSAPAPAAGGEQGLGDKKFTVGDLLIGAGLALFAGTAVGAAMKK